MSKNKRPILIIATLATLFVLSPSIVQADTFLEVASITEIGKNFMSIFAINYELIFGIGSFLNGILFLLIAWALPASKDLQATENETISLKKRQQIHQSSRFVWKKIFVLIGLIFLLIGILLLSVSALM